MYMDMDMYMYVHLQTVHSAYLEPVPQVMFCSQGPDTFHLPNEHLQQPTDGHVIDDIM